MENPNVHEVANLYPTVKGYNRMNGVICGVDGISQTIRANSGGHNEVKIAEKAELSLVGGIGEKKLGRQWRPGDRVYDSDGLAATVTANPVGNNGGQTALYKVDPCIGAIRGRNPDNPSDRTAGIPTKQRLEIGGDVSNTLTTVQKDNVVIEPNIRVRKLTPKETWRLMGFDDAAFDRAEQTNSNSQLYKQAGNSIVVNVLAGIIGQMIPGKERIYAELPDDYYRRS